MQDIHDIAVRLLTPADLQGALALSCTAGWNQRLEDWRMLLDFAPAGGFAAVSGDRVVGTAFGLDYRDFSWIAMMLVEPAFRGRGLGRRLLEAAMDALPDDTPIRLDATPLGRPLYDAYGFADECTLTRCTAGAAAREPSRTGGPRAGALDTRPLTAADLPGLAELDRRVFLGDRRAVLAWALEMDPGYAHAIESGAGVVQYCLGRRGRLFDHIGPVVAGTDASAQALVEAALRAADDRAVVMDVFDARAGFRAWLGSCGFEAQRPLFRMRRPPRRGARTEARPEPRATSTEFAILGPEFA